MSKEFIFTGDIVALKSWCVTDLVPGKRYRFTKGIATKKRTLDQNAQSHVWYSQIAEELPDDNIQGWTRYCKLHHGVPILRAEDKEFRAFYDKAIKDNLSYEEKLQAMDFTPVTRLMNTQQFGYYFEALQADFKKRGVILEFLR